jgi:hypothetical protein
MQSLLHLKEAIKVVKGDIICGTIKVTPQKINYRALKIKLTIEAGSNYAGFKQVYNLD